MANQVVNHLEKQQFNIKKNGAPLVTPFQTYNTFTDKQINFVLNQFITKDQLRILIVNCTNAQFLYLPIMQAIEESYPLANQTYAIRQVIYVLQKGRFYRFLNMQNQIVMSLNDKKVQNQKKCLIAAIFCYFTQSLKMSEIQKILKVFKFQQYLYMSHPNGIPLDLYKITKTLKKIDRVIKFIDFKFWFNDFRDLIKSQYLENFQFLYLVNMTQPNYVSESYFTFYSTKKKGYSKQKIDIKKSIKQLSQQYKRSISEAKIKIQGLKTCLFLNNKKQKQQTSYTQIKRKLSQGKLNLMQRKKCWSYTQKYKFNENQEYLQSTKQLKSEKKFSSRNISKHKKSNYEVYCQNCQVEFNRLFHTQIKKISQIISQPKNRLKLGKPKTH